MPLAEAGVALLGGKAADLFLELRSEAAKAKVRIDDSALRSCVLDHIRQTERWSRAISLLHSPREKRLDDHFVDLSLALGLERYGESGSAALTTLDEVYSSTGNAAILGGPGAGKTTSLQRLLRRAISEWESGSGGVPILIRLRDLRGEEGLTAHLLAELGVNVFVPAEQDQVARRKWQIRVAVRLLEQLSAVLMVDGLDEVETVFRGTVTSEIRDILLGSDQFRVILTCRTADYHVALPSIQPYTLRKLGSAQIVEFVTKWLGETKAAAFVASLARTPYAGTEVVPLLLAHLCVLFQRDEELPRRHVEVYEQIVALLVDKWDLERGIRRKSRHATLNWRGKERLLAALSFALTTMGRRGSFQDADLHTAYEQAAPAFDLAIENAKEVIDELESHTGLLLHAGYGRYDFLHLSIQEYLTAMHARGLPDPLSALVPSCPNELAIVIALSPDCGAYLEDVLDAMLTMPVSGEFVSVLLSRLGDEAPMFVPSARLGWVLLAFQYLLDERTADSRESPASLTTVLPQAPVASAIALAGREADAYDVGKVVDLIPSIRSTMPPFLSQALKDKRIRHIRAPKELVPPGRTMIRG